MKADARPRIDASSWKKLRSFDGLRRVGSGHGSRDSHDIGSPEGGGATSISSYITPSYTGVPSAPERIRAASSNAKRLARRSQALVDSCGVDAAHTRDFFCIISAVDKTKAVFLGLREAVERVRHDGSDRVWRVVI